MDGQTGFSLNSFLLSVYICVCVNDDKLGWGQQK